MVLGEKVDGVFKRFYSRTSSWLLSWRYLQQSVRFSNSRQQARSDGNYNAHLSTIFTDWWWWLRVLLDWIAQYGLQSNLLDWIVIDNLKDFVLSTQLCHFNPNPKYLNYFIKKFEFHCISCSKKEAKLLFIKIFKQLIYL